MNRTKLAKELRNLESWLADITSDGELMNAVDAAAFQQTSQALFEAAAALEEEERDARRMSFLQDHCAHVSFSLVPYDNPLGDTWTIDLGYRLKTNCERVELVYTGKTLAEAVDAALDAWLEEREKGGG